MDPVVHFEMPYKDGKRAAKFYKAAFGWQMQMLGEEMEHYVLATTVETGPKGPKRPGAINGGLYRSKKDWPEQHPAVVIAVTDIKKAMAKVRKAGGKVLGFPMAIPNVGSYVSFLDPEGNRVSILEPIPMNWHGPAKKPAPKKIAVKKTGKKN